MPDSGYVVFSAHKSAHMLSITMPKNGYRRDYYAIENVHNLYSHHNNTIDKQYYQH